MRIDLTNAQKDLICNALMAKRTSAMESARYWRDEAQGGFEPEGDAYAENEEATARRCEELIVQLHPNGRAFLRMYDNRMQRGSR